MKKDIKKLRGQDLNLRPSGYEPDELPDCSIPRYLITSLLRDKWMEVDSNHRSNLQQIYSLSPLATRESIQITIYEIVHHWKLSVKPMIGLEPITCWLQISCSANWATSAYNSLKGIIHQMWELSHRKIAFFKIIFKWLQGDLNPCYRRERAVS